MSLAAALGWSLVRCLAFSILAIPLCRLLSRQLRFSHGTPRILIWSLLLIPFCTPELMVGYTYSNYALSLVRHPVLNELFYAVLVAMKMIPIGTALLCFAPPTAPTAEAIHCRRLAFPPSENRWRCWWEMVGYQIRGPVRATLPAVAVLFLFSFQEFEMASLLQSTSWTVWLFDAQAGGLFLGDSLGFALLPLTCEFVVILPVLVLLLRNGRLPVVPEHPGKQTSLLLQALLWVYLLGAVAIVLILPMLISGRDAFLGLERLMENRSQMQGLLKEILTGFGFALVAGTIAYTISSCLLRTLGKERNYRGRVLIAIVLLIPGLLGSLVLSLSVLFVFQQTWLNVLYDTPVPLVVASILFLFPRALLIQLLLSAVYPGEAQHLATLLQKSHLDRQRDQGRALNWRLRVRGHFWGTMLVCYWAYWDLTTSAILSPVGVTSAPVRLYNLMHYGQNAVLSAMTVLTVVAPLLLVVFVFLVRRQLLRRLFP